MRDPASPDDPRVVLTTAPDADVATRLARGLVEAALVACVNVVPGVRSVYHWNGAVHDDAEVLLVAKTVAARVPAIEAFLAREHPYDCPECVALEVASVEAAYLAWLRAAARRTVAPGT
jgi:periplasmic divalent cation tolerance protein